MNCPECGQAWDADAIEEGGVEAEQDEVVRDVNGAVLATGDSVVVIKDLPVKGA